MYNCPPTGAVFDPTFSIFGTIEIRSPGNPTTRLMAISPSWGSVSTTTSNRFSPSSFSTSTRSPERSVFSIERPSTIATSNTHTRNATIATSTSSAMGHVTRVRSRDLRGVGVGSDGSPI